jgi:DnaJ-class molecular chaperone
MPTHYQTLGIDRTATDKELRDAFHAIARIHHSDVVQTEGSPAKDAAFWEEAQAAYEALKTSEKRDAYDARLSALAPKCLRCKGTKMIQKRTGWSLEDAPCPDCSGTGRRT